MIVMKSVLTRLRREYFPGSRFAEPDAGIAIAEDRRRRLASMFQPIVQASDGGVSGHQALLRAADEEGRALAPASLFDDVAASDDLGRLDRLARALHAVNYFSSVRGGTRLFLPVDPRLIANAGEDHRSYFDALLSLLDVPTSRIVVVFPAAALDDPVTFVRSTLSYATRGYEVLATLRLEDAHADLEHVFMASPNYVGIDASGTAAACGYNERWKRLRSIVASLRSRGICALGRRIENGADARAARDAGFTLLQGWHFAPPSPAASVALHSQ